MLSLRVTTNFEAITFPFSTKILVENQYRLAARKKIISEKVPQVHPKPSGACISKRRKAIAPKLCAEPVHSKPISRLETLEEAPASPKIKPG